MNKKKGVLITIILLAALSFIGTRQHNVFADEIEENKEEKIYCNATVDDDFEDDKITVTLTREASL